MQKQISVCGKGLLVFLAITAAGVFCGPSVAQEASGPRTRSVEGTVRNQAGQPVSGAVVQIENTRTLTVRSYLTAENGKYHFHELYANLDYRLRASYHDVFGPAQTLSRFTSNKVAMDLTVRDTKK